MSRPNEKKKAIVTNLSKEVKDAKSIILTDYRGMNMKHLQELRKNLKTVNARYTIAKNTLLKIALGDAGQDEKLQSAFTQPTAAIFANDDPIAPLKELYKFIKTTQLPKVKFGIVDSQILTAQEIERLSKLPSKEILLAQLLGGLNSPITGLVYALNGNLQKLVLVLSAIQKSKAN